MKLDIDGNYETTNTTQVYDPNNNYVSISPAKLIQARRSQKVIVYNDKLFVFKGIL